MTYEPIIVKVNENKKIELTEEELCALLKKAYENGYNEGFNKNITINYPTVPQPYTPPTINPVGPYKPFWYDGPTCSGVGGIASAVIRTSEDTNA